MPDPKTLLRNTLKDGGYSLTKARLSVFSALQHQEPQTMSQLVTACGQGLNRASVYRAITLFEALGIVQRLPIGWKYKLELSDRFSEHHHHMSCKVCGQVIAIPEDKQLEERLISLARTKDFKLEDHQIELRGICQSCRPKA